MTSDGTYTYTYDAEGRLSAVSGSGTSASYLYDPEGQRVESVVNGTVTTFGRDPQGRVVWRDLNQPYAQDIYLNGRHFGSLTTNGDANHTLNSVTYSMVDEVGTDREHFDGSQNALAKITSNPFGDNQITSGNTADSVFYTGKERDAESGLDYFGARYYSSAMGRFLSPDPIIQNDLRLLNPQRWNKYSYAINNPLTLTDPTGKDAAYVDFSKGAGGFGHAGLISIRSDGTATYSAFVPAGNGPSAYAPGQVQLQDLTGTVQFGANGLPTAASYDSLIQQVAKINGSDPYNVGIDYFKTTDAETSNLDQYIIQKAAAYRAGQAPTYKLCLYDCRDYALGGLVAAGVIGQGQAHGFSLDPNSVFNELNVGIANQQVPPEPKATVTSSECDSLPDGTTRCQ